MANSVLKIRSKHFEILTPASTKQATVGTNVYTTIDLLNSHGWLVKNWQPAIAEVKGGGSFRSSPLTDGRRLANRRFDNAIETFDVVLSSSGQNTIIYELQELFRLLQKATEYWTTDWQNEPVWIEAQGPCEDEKRYAVIVDYRLNGLNNPFSQPFFNIVNMAAMDGLTLVIERRHWQDTEPGADGTCVAISASQFYPEIGTLAEGTYEPLQSSDDVEAWVDKQVQLTDAKILVGNFEGNDACAGIRFDNVTVPPGAIITQAYVTFVMGNDGGPMDVTLNWQDVDTGMPATFDGTWLDWINRQRLTATGKAWHILAWNDTDTRVTPSLVDWVQESVDTDDWVNPGSMVLFVCPAAWGGIDLLSFYAFDNVAAENPPQLYIEWSISEGTEVGRAATCLNEVFVTNKHNEAPINHIYYYDTSLANWSANLVGNTTYPYDIMPGADGGVTPEAGDIIYFGSVEGPFNTIIFDLITAQVGITAITWAYYSGAGWTNFTVNPNNGNMCGNTLLDEDGVSVVTFSQPENWSTFAAAPAVGVTAFWIRATLTTVPGAATAARQQNRDIYTAVLPYVDITADQVTGDIPALARTIFDSNACFFRPLATLTMGLRSLDRGEDFTAYLNCSDEQNPVGVTFVTSDLFPVTLASEAPTGWNILSDATFDYNVFTNICSWVFSPDLATQYQGVYHAFVRVRQTAGEEQQVRFRLRAVYGTGYNVSYSDSNVTFDISKVIAVDLGQLIIPAPYVMRPGDQVSSMRIYLDAMLVNTTDEDEVFEVYDVVLLPTDEWVGTFAGTPEGTAETIAYEGKRIDVDGVTNPRMYRAMLNSIISDTSETIDAELFRIASANPILQANKEQRMWFLQTYDTELYSYFESNGTVRMQRAARYLAMRGDR